MRRNETETERKEGLVLVSAVGGRVCCNLDMNPKRCELQTHFPSRRCHSHEQLSALTRHLWVPTMSSLGSREVCACGSSVVQPCLLR